MNDNKNYLTRKELVSALGISLSTVDRGLKSGRWPFNHHVKIGKRVFFPHEILEAVKAKALSGMAAMKGVAHG